MPKTPEIPFQSDELGLSLRHPADWFADVDDGILYMGDSEPILEEPTQAKAGVGIKISLYPESELSGMMGATEPVDPRDPETLLPRLSDWLLAPWTADCVETLQRLRLLPLDGLPAACMVRRVTAEGATLRVLHAVVLRHGAVWVIQGVTTESEAEANLAQIAARLATLRFRAPTRPDIEEGRAPRP